MQIRPILAVVAALAAGLSLQAGAGADTAGDAKKALQVIYAKRDAAEAKKDLEGSLTGYAPDFVFVSPDGQKGDMKLLKRRLAPIFALMQTVKAKTQVQSVVVKGKDAAATVKTHLEMLILNPQTQMPQKVAADAVSLDTWGKTSSGWLQKRMATKSETATLDGKLVRQQLRLNGDGAKPGAAPKKAMKKAG